MTLLIKGLKKVLTKKVFEDIYDFSIIISVILDVNTNLVLLMMSLILKIDRWLLNHIFDRKRIFTVNLEDCFDDYGNSYGKRGSHFYIKILELRSREIETKNFLNQYYNKNQIKSLNQMLGKEIKHDFGKKYFLPWENGRVRNLEKFKNTHKIGPTSEDLYDAFLKGYLKYLRKFLFLDFTLTYLMTTQE